MEKNEKLKSELSDIAQDASIAARIAVLKMTSSTKTSHIGSCFSVIDLLASLYSAKFNTATMAGDNIILSKGHAAAALYAVLDHFKVLESDLSEYCKNGASIYGHVNHKADSNIPLSTGSLGHGLPFGLGMALAHKFNGDEIRTFVVMSDVELNEGTTWESALVAGHHKLSNLVVIIDRNRIQSLGFTEQVVKLHPIAAKWEAFGWETLEIDGHDFEVTINAIFLTAQKPICIIANTVKGKGVSFMEDRLEWHYKSPSLTEVEEALTEIRGSHK